MASHVPSKGNLLVPRKHGGGFCYDRKTKEVLLDINDQVRAQWSGRPPLMHPHLGFIYYVQTSLSDKDNKQKTIMDALVQGGVLVDDCIAKCNGWSLLGPAYRASPGVAGVRIFVQDEGDVSDLWEHMRTTDLSSFTSVKAQGTAWRSRIVDAKPVKVRQARRKKAVSLVTA